MKLLILSFEPYPEAESGIIRTMTLIEHLLNIQNTDLKIDVITTCPESQFSHIAQHERIKIRYVPVTLEPYGLVKQTWGFYKFVRQVIKIVRYEQYKLVYVNSDQLRVTSLAAWIAKRQHAALFLDMRALFVEMIKEALPKFMRPIFTPVLKKIEYWTLSSAEHVNLFSKGLASVVKARFPEKTVTCYAQGIANDFLHRSFQSKTQASEQFTLLYVGNIHDHHSLETIVPQLAKRLEGCAQIKIIGEGRRKIHLEATLQALHCINVEVLPAVPRDTLLQVYAQADVLLLHRKDCASQRNLLPSKLFEYAATGKPILAGVSGFAATFIQNEIPNAVVFRPGNSEDALNEIAKLHFRRQKREKFMHKYPLDTILHSMAQEFTVYFS